MDYIRGELNAAATEASSAAENVGGVFTDIGFSIGQTVKLCASMKYSLTEFFSSGSTVYAYNETGGGGKEIDNAGNTSTIKWQDNTYQKQLKEMKGTMESNKDEMETKKKELDSSWIGGGYSALNVQDGRSALKDAKTNYTDAKSNYKGAKSNYNEKLKEGWRLLNNNVDD